MKEYEESDHYIDDSKCTPFEDMPQGYKDGIKIAAQKLSDEVDKEIMRMITGELIL